MPAELPMHMGNEVLSPAVAAATGAASLAVLALCSRRAGASLGGRRAPLMGMMGALVFAAQMVNFPVPGGSSGHLGGGALLAIALGPEVAVPVLAAVLFLQALLFNDGGLLALGANLLNIGIVPAFVGAAVFRLSAGAPAGRARSAGRVYFGCFAAGLLGVAAGAVLVPFEIGLSGLLRDGVSFSWFLGAMAAIHLGIGGVEGVITFLVVAHLHRAAADLLPGGAPLEGRVRPAWILASLGLLALLAGAFLSILASPLPDGLEFVLGAEADAAGGPGPSAAGGPIVETPAPGSAMVRAAEAQGRIAPLPDYTRRRDGGDEPAKPPAAFRWDAFQAVAGISGALLVFALTFGIGKALSRVANRASKPAAAPGPRRAGPPPEGAP